MKFLADMGISPKTITFLQQLGYESIHLFSLGLHQLPDSKILKKARNEG
jgi:predicted nuclease of predicted toxin-antitoxin system